MPKDKIYMGVIKLNKGGWGMVTAKKKDEIKKGGKLLTKADTKVDAARALTKFKRDAEGKGKEVQIIAL